MAEYIKREAAVALIEEKQKELCPVGRWSRHEVYGTDREKFDAWQEIIDALNGIPTVDAVAVTRCKDCAYGDPTWAGYVCNCNEYAALESTLYHDENFFCSYGKPKEGGDGE